MRATGLKAKFLAALTGQPRAVGELVELCGVQPQRIHRLASRYRHLVERVDETPLSGPQARPVYAIRKHPRRAK